MSAAVDPADDPAAWVGQLAASWWREHRGEIDSERVFDLSMALFESVFTMDLAIEGFRRQRKG